MKQHLARLVVVSLLLAACARSPSSQRPSSATPTAPHTAQAINTASTQPTRAAVLPPTLSPTNAAATPTGTSTAPTPVAEASPALATQTVPTTAPTASATATLVPSPIVTVQPSPTMASPSPTPTAKEDAPASWLQNTILLGEYGRAIGVAPVLGRLGFYHNLDELAADFSKWEARIRPYAGNKQIRPEIHLIYAMATPCANHPECLLYLDDTGADIVNYYIKPAQKRGWLVVLDTQLGSSDPVTQVQRMISKGYLKYDNVEVAIDPEFHLVPGHSIPGIPIGHVQASQINAVGQLLGDYVRAHHLPHKKVMIVHSFTQNMIQDKTTLRNHANVDMVIDADGLGSPKLKTVVYNQVTDAAQFPFIRFRGIKLFPPSPAEERHIDRPLMTFAQVFGREAVSQNVRIQWPPNLITIT